MEAAGLWQLILFFICLILSAFFSSSETAFVAVPRARLMQLVNNGHARASLVFRMLEHPERLLATVLLSNNLVNTAAAALGTAIALSLIENDTLAVLASTLVVTTLLLIFSETLPKTVAWKRSEQVAFAFSRPLVLVQRILFPGILVLQCITTLFTRALGLGDPVTRNSEEEIRALIMAGAQSGDMELTEAALLQKVFSFGDKQMREIMTPRPEIIWIEHGTTLEKFLSLYSEHSHTRFPVFEGSMENILGVLSNKDVIVAMGKGQVTQGDSVTTLLRPAFFVPETTTISGTFAEMQQNGYGLVLTVNEYGGIAGLATLNQLLEVIVGAIGDESDGPDESYTTVDENTYYLDAGIGIAEVNEKLNLGLPLGDYQTVTGFILAQLGYVPVAGELLLYGDLKLIVKASNEVRIEQVEVQRLSGRDGQPESNFSGGD